MPSPDQGAGEVADDADFEVLEETVLEDIEAEELLNIYRQQNKQDEEIALEGEDSNEQDRGQFYRCRLPGNVRPSGKC